MDNNVNTLSSTNEETLSHHQSLSTETTQAPMMTNYVSSISSSTTTYLVPSVYPPFSTQSPHQSSTTNSGIDPISSYQIPTYTPPSLLTNTNTESQCLASQSNFTGTYQLPPTSYNNPPNDVIPEQTSAILPPQSNPQHPIYCSDGIIYPGELSSSNYNNVINNDDDEQDVVLSNELVDVYNNLGIVGKLLAGGSLVTIRFLQMFRNISETLVDALGIARPKYEEEIRAYEEMKQEEQQRQEEIRQLYAGWKPNMPPVPPPPQIPSNYFPNNQPCMSSDNISPPPISPPMNTISNFVTDSQANLPNP
ncbi:hypothetical protein DERF_001514 [Dermatophagoides farinae]|uniref:Uncharacterized protein n=1 Tax=Dermatophagoides farinae TaxID=6954 RepID=A0A922IDV6_DERFA|nr:hypothetical protein HUG17_4658 [Dermatophagoides farinae]KAH9527504.1 hypothetical protein DERF_001514 [Dermatophagoides farinae]